MIPTSEMVQLFWRRAEEFKCVNCGKIEPGIMVSSSQSLAPAGWLARCANGRTIYACSHRCAVVVEAHEFQAKDEQTVRDMVRENPFAKRLRDMLKAWEP